MDVDVCNLSQHKQVSNAGHTGKFLQIHRERDVMLCVTLAFGISGYVLLDVLF